MKIKSILTAIRNNPKKSLFFGSIFGFGVKYAANKYEEECLMRKFCQEALQYGEITQDCADSERHITVLLNPAANNSKCRANFDKYCAPLLHLAGLKVAVVRTEHEGQAKEIMGIMDNTNAVVVAGGDGTLQEVLTGLLRREDSFSACQKYPLGVLPLGARNAFASSLWSFGGKPKVENLAQAALDIVRNVTTKINVMEIIPTEAEDEEPSKPVFAATNLEWGAFRDAVARQEKYWYWGPLRKYVTFIFSSYKDLSWKCDCLLAYSHPCSGCQRCKALEEQRRIEAERLRKLNSKWWHAFIPRKSVGLHDEVMNYSDIVNENCGKALSLDVENVSDLQICTNYKNDSSELPGYALSVHLGRQNLGSLDFIKEGIRRANNHSPEFASSLIAGEITLTPLPECMQDKKGTDRELNIDNSSFEVKPMKLRPVTNAVTIFASRKAAGV